MGSDELIGDWVITSSNTEYGNKYFLIRTLEFEGGRK